LLRIDPTPKHARRSLGEPVEGRAGGAGTPGFRQQPPLDGERAEAVAVAAGFEASRA
jgi:hypothetical protein